MRITYANAKVEKYFTDFGKLKRKLPIEWVRSIKKHLRRLEAADTFADFLSLGLGKPERLSGFEQPRYSLYVAANVRLIIEVQAEGNEILICEEVEIEGVSDYHGGKDNWFIS